MKNRHKKLVEFSYKKLKSIFRILPKRNWGTPPAMESNDIVFRFEPEKTVQVAAMFLKLHGRSMNYLGLLKLIYMADRRSLERIDRPLTGDNYVSMKYGPVLSRVYDFIKGKAGFNKAESLELWQKYILKDKNRFNTSEENYKVILRGDPGNGELSEEEEEIIKEVYEECGDYDRFDLANMTHDFPEWQDPRKLNPSRKVAPIENIKILEAIGKNKEEIDKIKEIVERKKYLDEFSNARRNTNW